MADKIATNARPHTFTTIGAIADGPLFDIEPSEPARFCGAADYWMSLASPRRFAGSLLVTLYTLSPAGIRYSPEKLKKVSAENQTLFTVVTGCTIYQ